MTETVRAGLRWQAAHPGQRVDLSQFLSDIRGVRCSIAVFPPAQLQTLAEAEQFMNRGLPEENRG
jgi:hypothetical protein